LLGTNLVISRKYGAQRDRRFWPRKEKHQDALESTVYMYLLETLNYFYHFFLTKLPQNNYKQKQQVKQKEQGTR
jgi:hypothetical protein